MISERAISVAWQQRLVVRGPLLALALPLAACAAATPAGGSPEPADRAIAAVYLGKCGACHAPPDPKTRSRGYLEDALSRHRKRVRLTTDEWAELTDYLAMPEGKTARQP